jgi:diguanylate cyclase (GGDEF)-like protein/PAS domain S-box-containing protein
MPMMSLTEPLSVVAVALTGPPLLWVTGFALLGVAAGLAAWLRARKRWRLSETRRVKLQAALERSGADRRTLEAGRATLQADLDDTRRSHRTLVSNLPGLVYRGRCDRQRTMDRLDGECRELTGYDPEDLIGNRNASYGDLIQPTDRERVLREMEAALAEGRAYRITYRIRNADDEERWVWEQGRRVEGAAGTSWIEGFITDVSDRKRFEDQIYHDTFHDRLTALPNRSLFMDRLERTLHRWQRHPRDLFSVLVMDLDRFKLINDSLGHQFGDDLIVAVAGRLGDFLGPGHTVARLGGDEFAILVEDLEHPGEAVRLAERIDEVLRQPVQLQDRELFITASLGLALVAERYERAEDLVRDAEIAMYRAKALGGDRHEIFDSAMHQRAVAMLQLESDLRRAVHRQEFTLQYQPIVNMETRQPVGVEALLRWIHPEEGMILPGRFISVAEETGLIVPLGRWVLWEACRQLKSWQDEISNLLPLTVAVNLSSQQFLRSDLAQEVAEILESTGVDGNSLRLELTESILMEKADQTVHTLRRIKALDIRFSVDDFGTGYSSLSYLHRFPLDTIKIDRSFVASMVRDRDNREIVRTIITLAHALGMDVVAEGVETAEQADELRKLGCELAQGRYFYPPLDPQDLVDHLPRHGTWQPVVIRG